MFRTPPQAHRTSARDCTRTAVRFWVSFGSGRHVQTRELYQQCAVGIAVWRQQEFARCSEKGTSRMELFEWSHPSQLPTAFTSSQLARVAPQCPSPQEHIFSSRSVSVQARPQFRDTWRPRQSHGRWMAIRDVVACTHTSSKQPCGGRQWGRKTPVWKPS